MPAKLKCCALVFVPAGIATAKVLFNLSTFLTKRDKWAGTFDELYAFLPLLIQPLQLLALHSPVLCTIVAAERPRTVYAEG